MAAMPSSRPKKPSFSLVVALIPTRLKLMPRACATFAFIEDTKEQDEDAEGLDSDLYLYQQARAKGGYAPAIHYGVELIDISDRPVSP